MPRARRRLLVVALLLALVPQGQAQKAPQAGSPRQEAKAEDGRFERLQKRWRDRSEPERRELEERLERFRALPEETRREVLGRANVLREREHEMRASIPGPLRRELDALPPSEQRERWHAHVRERFLQRGHALRDRMPPELRERLEKAPPGARRHMAERLFRDRGKRLRELGISPEECRQWEQLPPEQRLRQLRERMPARPHPHDRGPSRREGPRHPPGPPPGS